MWIVVTGPMVARVSFEASVLTQVAPVALTGTGRVLFAVLLDQVRTAVEDGVRRVVAEIKKERLVLVSFDEFDCFQIQAVGEVLLVAEAVLGEVEPADRLGAKDIRPEIRSVADALDLASGIPVKAVGSRPDFKLGLLVFVSSEVPLTRHASGVAVASQDFGQGDVTDGKGVGGIRPQVVEYADSRGVLTGQERGPVRRADGSCCVGVCKANALLGQFVEVGGFVKGVPVASEFGPAEIIGENEDDVGLAVFGKSKESDVTQGEQGQDGFHEDQLNFMKWWIQL